MRILIAYKGGLFNFLRVDSSSRDGTLVVTLRRDGEDQVQATWGTRPGTEQPVTENFSVPLEKNKKITIHPSGRVNFEERRDSPIFIEPLMSVSKPTCFYGYRIPRLTALSPFTKEPEEEDGIFDLSDLPDAALSFDLIVAPANFEPTGRALKLGYLNKYSLTVVLRDTPYDVPNGFENHFTTFARDGGLFDEQQISEDAAMIEYHQALHQTRGQVLYSPNKKGEWVLIFSVPMRDRPKVTIELSDPDLMVEQMPVDNRARTAQVRFVVRNKSHEIVYQPVAIRSIVLDARL